MTSEFSCQHGGDFYVCAEGGQFVGCCMGDPCGGNGCSAGNLKPAYLPDGQYSKFSDQECDDANAKFYTCESSGFMGCCGGSYHCEGESCTNLVGSHLKDNEALAAPFLSLNSTWLATHTSTFSPTSSSASSSDASSENTMTTTTSPSSRSTSSQSIVDTTPTTITSIPTPNSVTPLNIGAVVGGAVGGFFVLALLIVAVLWIRRQRSHNEPHAPAQPEPDPKVQGPPQAPPTSKDHRWQRFSQSQPSPQSPPPPEYMSHAGSDPGPVHELAGATEWELDSRQRYHPYRPPYQQA